MEHCARRFRNRGEPFEDLVQVGTIGLLKSIDRFDLERGVEFSTYATPTIIGEIKRYFRDKGWAIRVPRRLQELRMQIGSASAELTQSLGRSPTPRELAERIGCSVEDDPGGDRVEQRLLDAVPRRQRRLRRRRAGRMLDAIGVDDENLEHVEIRESIKPLLDRLDAREKRILLLRFFKNMTQSQIAEEIGVSQMHVSRLLTRTLEQLRTSLEAGAVGRRLTQGASPRRRPAPGSTPGAARRRARPARRARITTATSVVSPPQKLNDEQQLDQLDGDAPGRAPTTAPGPAPGRRASSPAPRTTKNRAVVTPRATRAGVQARRPRARRGRTSSSPSSPTSTAAPRRVAGGAGRGVLGHARGA